VFAVVSMRTELRNVWVWMLAGVVNAVACYETKSIEAPPEDPEAPGGAGGEPSSPSGGAAGERSGDGGDAGAPASNGGSAGVAGSGGEAGGAETGGVGTGGVGTGGVGTGGTTGGHGTGGTSGGAGSGGTTGGADTGTGGTTPLPGVTWLSLEGNLAPASLEPNGELAIDGRFYAYADDCATLDWDPETRCATGTLCAAGPNFQNWGIAVGFYFDATGPGDTPPDTKYTWNPTTVGAEGVAWRISGDAPALALWVLNMDSAFGGECAEEFCEIVGAPDGTSTPKLQGTLSFGSLHKDDWNGSGIDYEFDPAAVHALQFKLPAIVAGAAEFSFCIDELGIVR
jgi:hypothetical protein